MKCIVDAEFNGLDNPTRCWIVVFRNVDDPKEVFVFEHPDLNPEKIITFSKKVDCWISHNFIEYDVPNLTRLIDGLRIDLPAIIDTLVVSRLLNFGISGGHSIEGWDSRLHPNQANRKVQITDWSEYTPEIRERCIADTLINLEVYNYLSKYIYNPSFKEALRIEHNTSFLCLSLRNNGFPFHREKATGLLHDISRRLSELDDELGRAFPPKRILVDTITPRITKQGAIHAVDRKKLERFGHTDVFPGLTYECWDTKPFDPGSLKDIRERMWEWGWKPTSKTNGYKDYLRGRQFDDTKTAHYKVHGWKVDEENLRTLPETAPEAARRLVERLLLASRISDLEEWLALTVEAPTGKYGAERVDEIHGRFFHIGSWTHRKSHSQPNMANIPVAQHKDNPSYIDILSDNINDQMRGLWYAPLGYRLVGTDAAGIQMRIFAHYVNDQRLIKALIEGRKEDGTDIHTLHKTALGNVCKGRNPAKTFIYAWLLGAQAGKVAEILECIRTDAENAIDNFIAFYPGLQDLKSQRIPQDAKRGYFIGLDGRWVAQQEERLILAGYLQNGESIVMKRACWDWNQHFKKEGIPYWQVNDVHDEWQTLIPDDDDLCKYVQAYQIESIRKQGRELGLNCPLDADSRFGYNWKETH